MKAPDKPPQQANWAEWRASYVVVVYSVRRPSQLLSWMVSNTEDHGSLLGTVSRFGGRDGCIIVCSAEVVCTRGSTWREGAVHRPSALDAAIVPHGRGAVDENDSTVTG